MFGSFGATGADVLTTDFYSFFHLAETARSTRPDGVRITYRPTGRFRDVVSVDVDTTATPPGGGLNGLRLRVGRSFVEDPRDGVFARDVVASFVREVAADHGDPDAVAALLDELRSRPLAGARNGRTPTAYTDENPVPAMPRQPGDFGGVFGVYSGYDAAATVHLADGYLNVSNDHVAGVGTFTASFRPAG